MSNSDSETALRGGLPDDDGLAAAFGARRKKPRTSTRPVSPAEPSAAGAGARANEQEEQPAAPDTPASPVAVERPDPVEHAVIPDQPGTTPARPAEPEPAGAAVPAEETPAPALPASGTDVAVRAAHQPAGATPLPLSELGIRPQPAGQRSTQCTVNVTVAVRDRFAAYQLAKKLERGAEPTNAVVVRRAVLHARRNDLFAQMLEYLRHRQTPLDDEDDDPDGLFGDVRGRRVERGRTRDIAQQSFRPSYEELAVIDALADAYGFGNRSDFVEAALDAFLPQLQERRRRS